MKWFYTFDHAHEQPAGELKALLGGKGAGLATMTQLGIPVPPGFTIPTTACLEYLDSGWSSELSNATTAGVATIEGAVGRHLGDPTAPLLVSVRSGAVQSMPGMMDTVLNAGMTQEVARGLAELTGDSTFAWDTFRRAITSYAQVVLGAPVAKLGSLEATATGTNDEERSLAFAAAVSAAGYPVPTDPQQQVNAAVEAVFGSWHAPRATAYRDREGIDHHLGTAANVQAMVFGNMGARSGTGVAFSRSPSSGEPGLMGDFLVGAQGEDVVAGTHQTQPLADLQQRWPDIWTELNAVATRLEHHTADMVDLEFTVEDGRLWLLQTRVAKRSPAATFRTAVQMANDPDFPVDRAEAVRRCAEHMDDPPRLPVQQGAAAADEDVVIAAGLAASPGRAIGVVSVDPDDAVAREQRGQPVILVRRETSPADVHGMAASVGLVTTVGGMVSHAAVVARSWGLAAVVGCPDIQLSNDAILAGDRRVLAGETITVDGDTGRVLLGERHADTQPLPEVATIATWARAANGQAATAEGSAEVNADDCLRTLALKGMAKADGLAETLGTHEERISELFVELEQHGLIAELNGGRMRPTPLGAEHVAGLYASESGALDACNTALEAFHQPNLALKEVVTAWQVRTVDGAQVPNDHNDPGYDTAVIRRLHNEVHAGVTPIIAELTTVLPRLGRYHARLEAALDRLAEDDQRYMAHPLLDSYHTVWFELHEELIKLAGRNRKDETEAGRA